MFCALNAALGWVCNDTCGLSSTRAGTHTLHCCRVMGDLNYFGNHDREENIILHYAVIDLCAHPKSDQPRHICRPPLSIRKQSYYSLTRSSFLLHLNRRANCHSVKDAIAFPRFQFSRDPKRVSMSHCKMQVVSIDLGVVRTRLEIERTMCRITQSCTAHKELGEMRNLDRILDALIKLWAIQENSVS